VDRVLVQRVTKDLFSVLIEIRLGEQFRVVASSPADGVYLRSGVSVPRVYILFSEPVEPLSLTGNLLYNETVLDPSKYHLEQAGHKLIINLAGHSTSLVGEHRVELGEVRAENTNALLSGPRVITWVTSSGGGSRTGVPPRDRPRTTLRFEHLPIEPPERAAEVLTWFYHQAGVRAADVVESFLILSSPEHERADLFLLFQADLPLPVAESVTLADGSCFYWDTSEPLVFTLSTLFSEAVDTSAMDTSVFFDDLGVPASDIRYSADLRMVEVVTRPANYGHHWLEFRDLGTEVRAREDEFMTTYVVHPTCCETSEEADELPPDPVQGDLIYYNDIVPPSGWTRLPGNSVPIRKFLSQTGDSGVPGVPQYVQLAEDDLPTIDVTGVKTSVYTASYREFVRVDSTSGAFAVNLPAATGNEGEWVEFKNASESTNPVTLDPSGSETIDGQATYTINQPREFIRLVSNGSNWEIA